MKRLSLVLYRLYREEFELSFTNRVEGIPWIATLIQHKTNQSHFKSSYLDDSHMADTIGLSMNFIPTPKMAPSKNDKICRHS